MLPEAVESATLSALFLEIAAYACQATTSRVAREEIIGEEMTVYVARAHDLYLRGALFATRHEQQCHRECKKEESIALHQFQFFRSYKINK